MISLDLDHALDLRRFYRFSPGDVLMVQPCNQPDSVDEFLEHLKLDPTRKFCLQPNESRM